MATDRANEYCDMCNSRCKTCYGPLSTNCISCPNLFTFSSQTSTCEPPATATDELVLEAYYWEGFTRLPSWASANLATNTFQCGLRTLLGGLITGGSSSITGSITVALSNLPKHFSLRVKASYYFLNADAIDKAARIVIGSANAQINGTQAGYTF